MQVHSWNAMGFSHIFFWGVARGHAALQVSGFSRSASNLRIASLVCVSRRHLQWGACFVAANVLLWKRSITGDCMLHATVKQNCGVHISPVMLYQPPKNCATVGEGLVCNAEPWRGQYCGPKWCAVQRKLALTPGPPFNFARGGPGMRNALWYGHGDASFHHDIVPEYIWPSSSLCSETVLAFNIFKSEG